MKQQKITRRSFAGKATAFAATSAVAISNGKSVLGANDRITVGMIGVGGRGTSRLSSFLREEDVSVAAICDVDPEHIAQGIERTSEQAGGTVSSVRYER